MKSNTIFILFPAFIILKLAYFCIIIYNIIRRLLIITCTGNHLRQGSWERVIRV